MDGPLHSKGDTTTWTYDSFGRVRTKTDESGYTLTFDYDALDRLTKITFPDATFDQYIFPAHAVGLRADTQPRQGRETYFRIQLCPADDEAH